MGMPLALAQQRPIFPPEVLPLAELLLEDEEEEDEEADEELDLASD